MHIPKLEDDGTEVLIEWDKATTQELIQGIVRHFKDNAGDEEAEKEVLDFPRVFG